MAKISKSTRHELVAAIRERYQTAARSDRVRIADEFVALTGYHRKHALRVLNGRNICGLGKRGPRPRLYNEAVKEALVILWEASDRVCAKRLRPLLPVLIAALERHGHLRLDEGVKTLLLRVSAATIDRLLTQQRAGTSGRRRRGGAKPAIRAQIPVRTSCDWNDPLPGYLEIDLVAHCGGSVAGSFAHTLVLTDIASGWTECVPLVVREGTLVADALERLRLAMPFPLIGIDSDNGSEFINQTVLSYCGRHGIEFTRSRPNRKNDQAWVEQKNGSVVRRLVGYGRLEGLAASETLARLYAASRLFVNFFQPSFKLAEKTRVGARVRKRYHPPETPCARLLACDAIDPPMKVRLHAVLSTLDPLKLLDEIRTMQQHIAGLAAGEARHVLPHKDADLERFLKSLATAWRDGEVRSTHREVPKPARQWRTRKDPFEDTWPQIITWLDAAPEQTAKELLKRLQIEHPSRFDDHLLRTLQRRVKEWRRDAARRLIFEGVSEHAGEQQELMRVTI